MAAQVVPRRVLTTSAAVRVGGVDAVDDREVAVLHVLAASPSPHAQRDAGYYHDAAAESEAGGADGNAGAQQDRQTAAHDHADAE